MLNRIIALIHGGEGLSVEFKKCSNAIPMSVYETVCAFLNRSGGDILFGVTDEGVVTGVEPSSAARIKSDFANTVNNSQKLTPTFYLNLAEYTIDGKLVLHVRVPESSQVHRCGSRIYDRNADGDYDITDNTLMVAALYTRKQRTYTENRIFPYAEMSDLRADLISRARITADNHRGGGHPWARLSDRDMLKSANLISKDLETGREGVTLAGILLFGKDTSILSALPHHRTDAILRVKNLDRYDDRDDIRTNLIESYDRLKAFVAKHLNDKFYLEGMERISLRDKIAREIIGNTLIHREYSNAFPAKLVIEKSRMYTENANRPNGVGEIDLNDFSPYPKNPVIAKVFKELGFADELGSGVRNSFKYTMPYSGANPTFEEGDIFRAIIPLSAESRPESGDLRPESRPESGDLRPESRPESGDLRPESRPESSDLRPESRPESGDLRTEPELMRKIIHVLRDSEAGKSEIAAKIGHTSVSGELNKQIRAMLKAGYIENAAMHGGYNKENVKKLRAVSEVNIE